MVDLGLVLAGDPCAADGWDAEREIRARAWHAVRTSAEPGPPSVAAVTLRDLLSWTVQVVERFPGLGGFLARGIVLLGKPRGH